MRRQEDAPHFPHTEQPFSGRGNSSSSIVWTGQRVLMRGHTGPIWRSGAFRVAVPTRGQLSTKLSRTPRPVGSLATVGGIGSPQFVLPCSFPAAPFESSYTEEDINGDDCATITTDVDRADGDPLTPPFVPYSELLCTRGGGSVAPLSENGAYNTCLPDFPLTVPGADESNGSEKLAESSHTRLVVVSQATLRKKCASTTSSSSPFSAASLSRRAKRHGGGSRKTRYSARNSSILVPDSTPLEVNDSVITSGSDTLSGSCTAAAEDDMYNSTDSGTVLAPPSNEPWSLGPAVVVGPCAALFPLSSKEGNFNGTGRQEDDSWPHKRFRDPFSCGSDAMGETAMGHPLDRGVVEVPSTAACMSPLSSAANRQLLQLLNPFVLDSYAQKALAETTHAQTVSMGSNSSELLANTTSTCSNSIERSVCDVSIPFNPLDSPTMVAAALITAVPPPLTTVFGSWPTPNATVGDDFNENPHFVVDPKNSTTKTAKHPILFLD